MNSSQETHAGVTETWHRRGMMIALLLLFLSAVLSMFAAALVRTPLVRTLSLALGSWAETARAEEGELS